MGRCGHIGKCPLGEYVDTSERIVAKREPRRRRPVAEKRRIVEETLEAGASVARVARAHNVNANQVFHWRRQYRQGLLGEGHAETVDLLPVHVTGGGRCAVTRHRWLCEGPPLSVTHFPLLFFLSLCFLLAHKKVSGILRAR